MKTIPLTNSDQVTIVDDWMHETLLALGPWRLSNGYAEMAVSAIHGRQRMHNVVLGFAGYILSGIKGDHRDRNRLDNRLSNLRPATHRQNSINCQKPNNTSGYSGVSWDKRSGRWESYISMNGKKKHLGYFTDKIEAAEAYDAALRLDPDAAFGVFNFPQA